MILKKNKTHVYEMSFKCQLYPTIGETVLNWFSSYLTNRRQKVKYEDVVSGVPHGTVLGPLLFNLDVNDIIKYVNHCNISLCADDTMLYI
jgi:ribonuclease P/MRP protein subunit RPP40